LAHVTPDTPLVFLSGPPGAGKSAAGSQACARLDLIFLDLSPPPDGELDPRNPERGKRALATAVARRAADVVALSWRLQQDKEALAATRRAGSLVLLWAHPLAMEARSARAVLTPVPRLKTHGGFGRTGTGCREFRSLDRACDECLVLPHAPLDEVVDILAETIDNTRRKAQFPPTECEGLETWAQQWHADFDADPAAARILVDAMARHVLRMREQGASERTLRDACADLQAAGMLVMAYLAPPPSEVLSCFRDVPCEFEYARRFSGSRYGSARYRRSLSRFGDFLVRQGLVPEG